METPGSKPMSVNLQQFLCPASGAGSRGSEWDPAGLRRGHLRQSVCTSWEFLQLARLLEKPLMLLITLFTLSVILDVYQIHALK